MARAGNSSGGVRSRSSRPLGSLALLGLGILLQACGSAEDVPREVPPPVLLGAHYYTWYGTEPVRHWDGGVWREPLLGRYSSEDPMVAAQHVAWAADAGIDVLAVDWVSPGYPEQALRTGLLAAPNLGRIRFCLFYDIANRLPDFGSRDLFHISFDRRTLREGVVADLERLAREYFHHPRYFRIGGKPVLWLYLTRNYEGPWAETLAEARRRMGEPVHVIADEVWFGDPDPGRLGAFEALSSYNLYDTSRLEQRPVWSLPEFDALVFPLQQRWHEAVRPKPVHPVILPGYDDSSVPGRRNPPVLAGSREEVLESFLQARALALQNADPEERIVWVTSFNEWHEGTAVEPAVSGMDRLEILRDAFGR